MTDDYERMQQLFGTGKADQIKAAAADAWDTALRAVDHGARVRMARENDMPPRMQELVDLYRDACQEARERYEAAVPEAERVPGRLRWHQCSHVSNSPQPLHWYVTWPEVVVCGERCGPTKADRCDRCGAKGTHATDATLMDQHSPVLIHATLCDECYPEGADAPAYHH